MVNPNPYLTEADVSSQEGRIFLITGGYSGCGYELVKSLYHLNGKVYIAGRSEAKAKKAIQEIKKSVPVPGQTVPSGKGSLHFLHLDLADLRTIKSSATKFLQKENRLDVIWHNAAVMIPPDGSVTAQGHDLQIGVNAYGPWLFQYFLTPVMLSTAALPDVAKYSTRIIWVSSVGHCGSPKPDGINWLDINNNLSATGLVARLRRYGQSKALNNMYAYQAAQMYGDCGVASLSVHPGRFHSSLEKDMPRWLNAVSRWKRKHPRHGGLTELCAGFCEMDDGKNGEYVTAYGRFEPMAAHVNSGLKERGTGERLWKVTEHIVQKFM